MGFSPSPTLTGESPGELPTFRHLEWSGVSGKHMTKTYKGSCHCGAVQFECELDLSQGTNRCNCSFCRKARFWMAIAKGDAFRLLKGAEVLTDYQHTPPSRPEPFLHLLFCSRCGVRPFSKGGYLPQFGAEFHAVNIGCLDDATDEELTTTPIRFLDGRHDDFSRASDATRYL
jgi:hypothetical protein